MIIIFKLVITIIYNNCNNYDKYNSYNSYIKRNNNNIQYNHNSILYYL